MILADCYDLVVFIFGDQLHAKQHSEQVYAIYERGIVAVVFHFNNPSITFMPRLVIMAWSTLPIISLLSFPT